jgi:hypothetical protein
LSAAHAALTIDYGSRKQDSIHPRIAVTTAKNNTPRRPAPEVSELNARQRYLLKKLSEAGLLTPLLQDLQRNVELASKKPTGMA